MLSEMVPETTLVDLLVQRAFDTHAHPAYRQPKKPAT